MISIIIPTCNEEKYINKTVGCLLGLSYDKEIIVTDDASTDQTLAVLAKYGDKIKVLTCEQRHISIAANRNAGAKYGQGEFLVFLDASTYIKNPDDFFKQALATFDKDQSLVAITGQLKVFPEMETFSDKIVHFFFNLIIMLKDNYLGMGEASGKFQMIKKEAFQKVGGFSEYLITREDSDMFNKLSKIGKIRYVDSLEVFHTSRRSHILGWPRLLFMWMINTFWVTVFGKAKLKEWSILR